MIALTAATRVFVALDPVDLRKSFSGLQGWVQDQLGEDPLSGHVFLFVNRSRTRIKLWTWDGSGAWVAAKRLERGKFSWPAGNGSCGQLRPEEFHALVNGLVILSKKDWYRK
jgi:transposase